MLISLTCPIRPLIRRTKPPLIGSYRSQTGLSALYPPLELQMKTKR